MVNKLYKVYMTDAEHFPDKEVVFTVEVTGKAGLESFIDTLKAAPGFNVEITNVVECLKN